MTYCRDFDGQGFTYSKTCHSPADFYAGSYYKVLSPTLGGNPRVAAPTSHAGGVAIPPHTFGAGRHPTAVSALPLSGWLVIRKLASWFCGTNPLSLARGRAWAHQKGERKWTETELQGYLAHKKLTPPRTLQAERQPHGLPSSVSVWFGGMPTGVPRS